LLEELGIYNINSAEWNGTLLVSELKENGKRPDPPTILLTNETITWKPHYENDVIGYRVYCAEQKGAPFRVVSTVKAGKALSFSNLQTKAIYYVTAVDISGKESPPSNIVSKQNPAAPNQGETKTSDSPSKNH
jgi:penicillin-binding protein 1B